MKYNYLNGVQKSMSKKVTAVLASLVLMVTPLFNTVNAILPAPAKASSLTSTAPYENQIIYKSDGPFTISASFANPDTITSAKWELSGSHSTTSDNESHQTAFARVGNTDTWSGIYALNNPGFPNGSFEIKFTAENTLGEPIEKIVGGITLEDQRPAEPEASTAPAVSPEISQLEASFRSDVDMMSGTGVNAAPVGYKGIAIETSVKNAYNIKSYTVTVGRESGGSIAKQATPTLLGTMNARTNGKGQVSTPFIIEQGNYNEYKSSSWAYAPESAPAIWSKDTKPTSVKLCVEFNSGPSLPCKTIALSDISGNWEDVVPGPVYRADVNGHAEEYYSDIQSANDDNDGKVNGYTHTTPTAPANYGSTVDGDTLVITSDVTANTQTNITKKLTIDGGGNTVNANGAKVDGSNNSAMTVQSQDGVVVKNIIFDGQNGTDLHGLNFYNSTNGVVEAVTAKNFRTGLSVNSSTVTAQNVTTASNSWHGINVDTKAATDHIAKLTIQNTSAHSENSPQPASSFVDGTHVADIFIDDISDGSTVVDSDGQYQSADILFRNNTARVYSLKLPNAAPTLAVSTPAESSYISTSANGNKLKITGDFKDDVKANYANFQLVKNGVSVKIGIIYGHGSVFNPTATYANANGSYSYDLSVPAGLENGEYSLFYTGTDFTGGVTERMERKFKIDNTAPSKPVVTKPSARQWFNTSPIKTQWSTATDDTSGVSRYQIAYHYDDNHSFGGSTCSGEVINGKTVSGCRDTQATSRDHNPDQSEQGGVTVWVRAIDKAGNKSAWSQSVHYYYDITPPSTTFEVPSGTTGGKFTVKGKAKDNLGLNRVYVQLISRQDNQRYGGTTVNLIPKGTNGDWSVDYDFSALNLPDGKYAAHASVTDMAGNSSSVGWTDDFTVDSTAPVVSSIKLNGSNVESPRATNCGPTGFSPVSGKIDLSATIKDASTVSSSSYSIIKVNDGGCIMSNLNHDYGNGVNGYQSNAVNMSQSGDSWSTPSADKLDTKELDLNGRYTIALTTKDQFGNSVTQYVDLEIDNTAPEITINTPTVTETSRTVTGTITGNPSSVKITVNGVDYTVEDLDPVTGAFSLEIDPLPIGEHRVEAVATDALGNSRMDDSKKIIIIAPTNGNGDTDNNQDQEPAQNNGSDGQVNPGGNPTPPPASANRPAPRASRPVASVASGIASTFSNFALTPLRTFGLIADSGADGAAAPADTADAASTDTESEVLGAKDFAKTDSGIMGRSDDAKAGSAYRLFGVAWYWIVAATAALFTGWWLLAAKRRRKADQTV